MDGSRNEGLQAARALAALSVAYFHSYAAVRGIFPETAWVPIPSLRDWGFLGVNFFFAISGYVICLVVSKPSFTVRSFVIKRVFRLYPMYWVTMAMVVVLIAYGKYRPEPVGHFLYSMTLLPQEGSPAYDLSWTLEREIVFYALAALVVPFLGIPGLAFTLAVLALAGWWFGSPWSFHLISTTQADFLGGVFVFLARPLLRNVNSPLLIAIGSALLWFTRAHDFQFSATVSMALILAGMVGVRLPWSRAPLRWLVNVGNASYSIYLLHYIVFLLVPVLAVRMHLSPPAWVCEPWRYATLLLCCLLSGLTWRWIETPMINVGNHVARRPRTDAKEVQTAEGLFTD